MEKMKGGRRTRRWDAAAVLALQIHAYGAGRPDAGAVRRAMSEAAGRALAGASDTEREIYRLEFVDGMDYKRMSMQAHMSVSRLYRVRGRLLERVKAELQR